jgi:DNA primase small subunit
MRHQSTLELGTVADHLHREGPNAAYFSSAYYDSPSTRDMDGKGWQGADLIFDLDADEEHMTTIDPETDTYADRLAKSKEQTLRLLDLLRDDFGFEDLVVVFSGRRGYHVHVRDARARYLGAPDGDIQSSRSARNQLINYVSGGDYDVSELIGEEGETVTDQFAPLYDSWHTRVYTATLRELTAARMLDDDDAIARLSQYDGIGEKKAAALCNLHESVLNQARAGRFGGHPALSTFVKSVATNVIETHRAEIDTTVTSDPTKLIRLPGSLHGSTGLRVIELTPEALDSFDPLRDAVVDAFVGNSITIDVEEAPDEPVTLNGTSHDITTGTQTVPEYVGVYLMARGLAEKVAE